MFYLISFSIMSFKLIYVESNIKISFFSKIELYSSAYVIHNSLTFLIYSFIHAERLWLFPYLDYVNNTIGNIESQNSL